jgi:hypothetical protein
MGRSFLILTTLPEPPPDDPSERSAVLAARREEALEAWSPDVMPEATPAGAPRAVPSGRTFFGFVDRLGRTHSWPGFLREHRVR